MKISDIDHFAKKSRSRRPDLILFETDQNPLLEKTYRKNRYIVPGALMENGLKNHGLLLSSKPVIYNLAPGSKHRFIHGFSYYTPGLRFKKL